LEIFIPILLIIIFISIFIVKKSHPSAEELRNLNSLIEKRNIDKRYLPKKFKLKLIFIEIFPQEYIDILEKNFYLYNFLPKDIKTQLNGHINVFLHLKQFQGYNIEITTEIKVTIAAQACMLLLNKVSDYFPKLQTVEIYPEAFTSEMLSSDGTYKKQTRSGESWSNGRVILSWSHSKQGISNFRDGNNVVMHEFAHRLDQSDNITDGIPTNHLKSGETYYVWRDVIYKEYQKHLKKLKKINKKNNKLLLTEYAGTNEAEFFAVATEFFFEKANKFKKSEPRLYELLKDFYNVDPSLWLE
jgi:hypothetical protein